MLVTDMLLPKNDEVENFNKALANFKGSKAVVICTTSSSSFCNLYKRFDTVSSFGYSNQQKLKILKLIMPKYFETHFKIQDDILSVIVDNDRDNASLENILEQLNVVKNDAELSTILQETSLPKDISLEFFRESVERSNCGDISSSLPKLSIGKSQKKRHLK